MLRFYAVWSKTGNQTVTMKYENFNKEVGDERTKKRVLPSPAIDARTAR